MSLSTILWGLLSEAWSRSITSYSRSLEYYHARVRDGVQPSTPIINIFDVKQQNMLLITTNIMYLIITMSLFIFMKRRTTGLKLRWYVAYLHYSCHLLY